MDLRLRRLFYLSFMAAFAILAVVLLLYARGFRLDFTNRHLVKTGSLVIETQPTRARVSLNGKPQSERTNTVFEYLVPGTYIVRLEKEGYLPREYTVEITPRVSSFLTDVNLFPQPEHVTETLLAQNVDGIARDPWQRYLVATRVENGSTELFTIATSWFSNATELVPLATIPSETVEVRAWDSTNPRLLLSFRQEDQNVFWAIDLSTRAIEDFSSVALQQSFRAIVFGRESNTYAAITTDGELLYISKETREVQTLDSGPWIDLTITNDHVWLLDDLRHVWVSAFPVTPGSLQDIATVGDTTQHRFSVLSDLVVLETSEQVSLFMLSDGRIQELSISDLSYPSTFMLQDPSHLVGVYSTRVVAIDTEQGTTRVITRSSTNISDAVFHNNGTSVFLATHDGLEAKDWERTAPYNTQIPIARVFQQLATSRNARFLFGLTDDGNLYRYTW